MWMGASPRRRRVGKQSLLVHGSSSPTFSARARALPPDSAREAVADVGAADDRSSHQSPPPPGHQLPRSAAAVPLPAPGDGQAPPPASVPAGSSSRYLAARFPNG